MRTEKEMLEETRGDGGERSFLQDQQVNLARVGAKTRNRLVRD